MSKLENKYNQMKTQNKDIVYILRSGIFYIFMNEDAVLINKTLGLKITDLGPNIIKCGFPISQIEKYKSLLDEKGIKYQIIDDLPNSNVEAYLNDIEIKKILHKIANLNMDEISFRQAYDMLLEINKKLKNKPISD